MRLHVHWWHMGPSLKVFSWTEDYRACRCGALQKRSHILFLLPPSWMDVDAEEGDELLHRLSRETLREYECAEAS